MNGYLINDFLIGFDNNEINTKYVEDINETKSENDYIINQSLI